MAEEASPIAALSQLVEKTKKEVARRIKQNPSLRVRLGQPFQPAEGGLELNGAEEALYNPGQIESKPIPLAPWAAELWSFEEQIKACEICVLGKGRKNFVFGEGKRNARLMFVGEAPGSEEDQQGRPFVGAAGKMLTRIIQAMGFRREDVFLTNTIKCRPPQNRAPLAEEVKACWPFLEHQIRLVQPIAVVLLGETAVKSLLKTEEPLVNLRGKWQRWDTFPVMPTFHPAQLLRDSALKRHVWDDMKMVMKKLEGNAS